MCSVDSVIPEAVPVSVTTGQVAGLRIRGEPHAEVGNARPGGAGPIAPERLVGDQIPEWRQTVRLGGSSGVAATVGHAQALAPRWPSWRAQAAPTGDHRLRLSQHGRLCVRILAGVVGEGDSPERFGTSASRWCNPRGS